MTKDKILISVVVPMYNASRYLNECLDSILKQSYDNLQVICVDDGSTDETREIIKSYQKSDSRVEYLYQEHQSAGAARNKGLHKVKGKYVLFLDADDIFLERMIESLLYRAETKQADIVICGSMEYDNETRTYGELDHSLDLSLVPKEVFSCSDIPDTVFQLTAGWAWDKMYRTEFVREKQISFQDIKIANDELFVDIAYAEAERIAVVDEKLVIHRTHVKTSIEFNRVDFWESSIEMLYEEKKELLRRGKYNLLKNSFVNRAARYLTWHACTLAETNHFSEFYDKVKQYVTHLDIFSIPRSYYHDVFYYDELQFLSENSAIGYVGHVLKRTNLERRREKIDSEKCINELKKLISRKSWRFSINSTQSKVRIVIYGYGDMGHDFVTQIEESEDFLLVGVIDRNWMNFSQNTRLVQPPEDIKEMIYDYVLIGVYDLDAVDKICEDLMSYGVPKEKILSRKNNLLLEF